MYCAEAVGLIIGVDIMNVRGGKLGAKVVGTHDRSMVVSAFRLADTRPVKLPWRARIARSIVSRVLAPAYGWTFEYVCHMVRGSA